jgi:hypothetical protein
MLAHTHSIRHSAVAHQHSVLGCHISYSLYIIVTVLAYSVTIEYCSALYCPYKWFRGKRFSLTLRRLVCSCQTVSCTRTYCVGAYSCPGYDSFLIYDISDTDSDYNHYSFILPI